MYKLNDLIDLYAQYHEIGYKTAKDMYKYGRISNKDLLEAYLFMEGIYGYTDTLWSIFETLR